MTLYIKGYQNKKMKSESPTFIKKTYSKVSNEYVGWKNVHVEKFFLLEFLEAKSGKICVSNSDDCSD